MKLKKAFLGILTIGLVLISEVAPIFDVGLNTKKINRNIEKLLTYQWFENLYTSERYRHLFFGNKLVRKKLSSNYYIKNLSKHPYAQKKFQHYLEKQQLKFEGK